MEWNNVYDTLPAANRMLLVRASGNEQRALYTGTAWVDTAGQEVAAVTHWRADPDITVEFDMYYEGKMVAVRIESGESDYGVFFDDQLITQIEQDEDCQWEDQANILDEDVVEYIGGRITSHFM